MNIEYVDTRQAADILQLSSHRQVYAITDKAGLQSVRVGRFFLYRRVDIEALAQERGGKRLPGRPATKKATPEVATP